MLRTANNLNDRASSLRELEQTKAVKDKNVPEWPEDDDDDDINNNMLSQTKELHQGSEEESVDQTDNGSVSVSAKNATSEFNVDKSTTSSPEQTEQLSIEQDNGGADEEIITNDESVDSSRNQQQTYESNSEKVQDEVRDIDNGILTAAEEEGSPSMEYHRSQSTVQNEVLNDNTELGNFDESEIINNDQVSENINTGDEINVENDEIRPNNDMTLLEGGEIANANNVDVSVPSTEQADEQQPSQSENTYVQNYSEDDKEESFLAMIQSTLQVLFLAAFFSSILVFRKRVQNRMSDNPSLDSSQAMKDEIVNVMTSFVSWLSENQNNDINSIDGVRFVMPTIAEGGSSVGGFETIPLATATDEEWGWDDEDVGGNLELPGPREDNTNEDDDLAMAIAMSLSESGKAASNEPTVLPADATTKQSLPVPSPAPAPAPTVIEQPHQQVTPQPADAIEDLLGQMSSGGGSVISSFGEKSKVVPKSKPKPINDGSDDIFASLGLSSFHTKSAPSPQPKTNTPSTLLKAESIDSSDDWGDDGDLDDLLLED